MMTRRGFLISAAVTVTVLVATRLRHARAQAPARAAGAPDFTPLTKSKDDWKKILTHEQYDVLFKVGTERPHSSKLNGEKRPGTFVCAACFLPLFRSDAKYESGTGWPSFFEPIPDRTATRTDYKLVFPRTEHHCARCGGHQGHVFDGGPQPTGRRWCNNGIALRFVPADVEFPELRT